MVQDLNTQQQEASTGPSEKSYIENLQEKIDALKALNTTYTVLLQEKRALADGKNVNDEEIKICQHSPGHQACLNENAARDKRNNDNHKNTDDALTAKQNAIDALNVPEDLNKQIQDKQDEIVEISASYASEMDNQGILNAARGEAEATSHYEL